MSAARMDHDICEIEEQIRVLQIKLAKVKAQKRKENTENNNLPMTLPEYRRYGRQMILEEFGLAAQLRLRSARVLVIGAGGLGCPALLYLAAAGIGHFTIVDHDRVELSNLHRQVLHTESSISMSKVESVRRGVLERNSLVSVETFECALTPEFLTSGALAFESFDIVLDCSDNAATRYLLNDACVAHKKTLVSGAAIRTDGQVAVWNLPSDQGKSERGPCLRCVFPLDEDANSAASQNCEDEGVLGTVTGIIGVQMASETVKLLIGKHDLQPGLLLYHPLNNPQFRQMKIKGRKDKCLACSDEGAARLLQRHAAKEKEGLWQIATCGFGEQRQVGDNRLWSANFAAQLDSSNGTLLDVRSAAEFSICSLPNATNIPLRQLLKGENTLKEPVHVVCRRGNDSAAAVDRLRSQNIKAVDLAGGLGAWSQTIDSQFPVY